MRLNRSNLHDIWLLSAAALLERQPNLSPARAGELAAARLNAEFRRDFAEVSERVRRQECYDDDAAVYDAVCVDGWNPAADLIAWSGTRTLILDTDDVERSRGHEPGYLDGWLERVAV